MARVQKIDNAALKRFKKQNAKREERVIRVSFCQNMVIRIRLSNMQKNCLKCMTIGIMQAIIQEHKYLNW